MRIAIIQFPGSNCERETMLAVKRANMTPCEFLWNDSSQELADFDGYILVGGFSYEDRVRAGIMAALDPLMNKLKVQNQLGKPILGICNGAQILVETGLVPGLVNDTLGACLTDNKRMQQGKVMGTGYYNAWIHMRLSDQFQRNAFTRYLTPKQILKVPIAHAEGRFVIPPALLAEMHNNGQHVFQYCNAKGEILPEFPINPNGSIDNIAAISNKAGNVLAMMPHPERTNAGDAIFLSMRDYIAEKAYLKVQPMYYQPRFDPIQPYPIPAQAHSFIVELMITDNHAMSLENTLNHSLGAQGPVKITRYLHWELHGASEDVLEKIKKTGVLFNDRKEKIVSIDTIKKDNAAVFLVRAKEDIQGLQKTQLLKNHFGLSVDNIQQSVLWRIEGEVDPQSIINANILFNPYAHDYYTF